MFRFFIKPGPRYSLKRVIVFLSLSLTVSASLFLFPLYLVPFFRHHFSSHKTPIEILVQAGPEYAPLSTHFLARVLDLSCDYPTTLADFDLTQAEQRLLATHLINRVVLKKIRPNILYVEYTCRQPIAFLEDFSNTAIDYEGVCFPFAPFFSPRHLPKVYLGESAPPNPWGVHLQSGCVTTLNTLFAHLSPEQIDRVDFSHASEASKGRCELVVLLKDQALLRLTPKNYAQELAQYFMIKSQLDYQSAAGMQIDLRIPHVAYLKERE